MTVKYQSPVRILRAASNEMKKMQGEEQLNKSVDKMATIRAGGTDDATTFKATAHSTVKEAGAGQSAG